MASDYKGRFGLFALLPFPSVDDSLKEIEYALDTLKAPGVGLLTSYGIAGWVTRRSSPCSKSLNRRKAIVYTHPIDAPCCQDLPLPGVTPTTLEFPTDTTRTILSLIASDAATRYGDIRFIFSHGANPADDWPGGGRWSRRSCRQSGQTCCPNSRLYHLRRFYYDTAMSTNPVQIQALKQIACVSQILFGMDYPFGGDAVKHRQGLARNAVSPRRS